MRIRTAIAAGWAVLAVAAFAALPANATTAARLATLAQQDQPVAVAQPAAAAASPKQLAETAAASMLAAFRSPPGAERSGPIPVAALSDAPGASASPDYVTRTAWWRVPGQLDDVLSWIQAHRPAGFTLGGSGSSSDSSGITARFVEFSPSSSAPAVLAERSLYVSVAHDGADATALRVDSQVSWLPRKSAAERIPAAARVVTIVGLPAVSNGPVRPVGHFYGPVTVTDPATVTKIAAVVNGLPLMPPGVFNCPFSNGQGVRLTFRASVHGPVLAEVTGEMNGCGTVAMVIGGKQMPALSGGGQLAQRVLKLAGIHWAGF